jgi:23S rRNA pseudouridine1911/1915/1917 synthase
VTASLTVTPEAAGLRLDVFLAQVSPHSRSRIQQLITQGEVEVNGGVQPARYMVRAGDSIRITQPNTNEPQPPEAPHMPIIYEDANLMVIDKPAGLVVHAGAGTAGSATVADFARSRTSDPDPERPGIVHRLDRDTSGLLLIAKNLPTKQYLQTLLRQHRIIKTYTALVIGRPHPAAATIDLPLGRDRAHPLRQAVVPGGREAITFYRTIATYPGYSLISAQPKTGRTHQLRVHFAAIGHPIVGDNMYGNTGRQLGLPRQFLHATTLEFTTQQGTKLKLTNPLPPDLDTCLSKLDGSV